MSNRPDSPWHYARVFYALVRAHNKLHKLIRFVGRNESFQKSESDNEKILEALDDIEGEIHSIRRSVKSKLMDLTLVQKIEAELSRKESNAGQLLIALGGTYPEIYTAIKQLSDEGKVVHGWKNSTLTYYLRKIPSEKV